MTSYSPFGNYTDVSKLMFSAKAEMELARHTETMRKQDRLWNPTRHSSAFRPVRRSHRLPSKCVVSNNSDEVVTSNYAPVGRPILPRRYRDTEHKCEHFGKSSYRPTPDREDPDRREMFTSVSASRSMVRTCDPFQMASPQSFVGSNAHDDLLKCFQECSITDEPVLRSEELNDSRYGNDIDREEPLSSASNFRRVFQPKESRSLSDLGREKNTSSSSFFGKSFPRSEPRSEDDFDRDEFLSSTSDLDSGVQRYDTEGDMSSASMSGLVERYVEQVVEQKMREKSAQSQTVCVFCRRNGETREYYSTHVLKDTRGKVICPVLQKYVCPRCRATGDRAHTLRHCPLNDNRASIADAFNTPRTSNGFRKF